MFGLSFGELVILGVIALVVVGPRRLPTLLRTAGQVIGKVRRMAMDIRTQSGIDEILEAEGIRSEIDNFRRLATGEITLDQPPRNVLPDREREYPRVGSDAYGALAEDIVPYSPAPALEGGTAGADDVKPVPAVEGAVARADLPAPAANGVAASDETSGQASPTFDGKPTPAEGDLVSSGAVKS